MATRPPARLTEAAVTRFLKWCRGMLGVAVTWGAVWGTIFAGIFLAVSILDPGSIDPGEGPIVILRTGAFYGFVSGAVFGVLLSLLERGRRVADLSLLRAAAMGAVAAAPFILLTPADAETVFKGETLRSILLNAYGWWTVASIALWAGIAMVLAGILLGILSILGFRHASQVEAPSPSG